MRVSKAQAALPIPVRRALKKLGGDIAAARKRRGITCELLAARAFINRKSLTRVEHGEHGTDPERNSGEIYRRLAATTRDRSQPRGRLLACALQQVIMEEEPDFYRLITRLGIAINAAENWMDESTPDFALPLRRTRDRFGCRRSLRTAKHTASGE